MRVHQKVHETPCTAQVSFRSDLMMSATEGIARRGTAPNDRAPSGQQQRANQMQNATRDLNSNQSRKGGRFVQAPHANNKTVESPSVLVPPAPEEYLPIQGFNSVEVDALLRKAVDPQIPIYKSDTESQQPKGQNPWASKGESMANGRDFYVELRKQVTALQQSGGISQGG